MAKGTIVGSTNNQYIKCKIEWTSTQNVAANTSSVTAKLYYWRTNTGYRTYGAEQYTLTINGVSKTVERGYSDGIELTNSTPVLAHTFTTTVAHNADGKKSVTIKATGGKTSGSFRSTSCSGTATLDTIPRATIPTLSTKNLKLGGTLTISLPRAAASFTHRVTWKFGSQSGTIASAAGTSCSWTPPESLATQIPNSASGSCTITVQTLNGSTSIGTKTASLTLTVSDGTVPSASLSITEAEEEIAEQFGAYIQSKSRLAVSLTGAGVYGSTVKSYRIEANGRSYSSQNATTDPLTADGENQVTGTVTDSRGKNKTVSQTVTVLPYAPPAVTALSAARCDADGTANDGGDCARVSLGWAVSSCGGQNTRTAKVEYRQRDTESWSTQAVSLNDWSGTTEVILTGISTEHSYDVRATVSDFFGSSQLSGTVPTAFTLVDYRAGGRGIAFGKVAEADGMDVNLPLMLRQGLSIASSDGTNLIETVPMNLNQGEAIPTGADLNDYVTPGTYTFLGSDASSISNYPPGIAKLTFRLTVMKTGDTTLLQIFVCTDVVCIRYNNRYDNIDHYASWQQLVISDGTPAGAGSTRDNQLQMNKVIWSGSWASGAITVPYLDNYLVYKINFSEIQTGILVVKNGTNLRGVGGNSSNAQTFRMAFFSANRSGDTLTLVDAHALDPLNGREDGALTVTNIIGIC